MTTRAPGQKRNRNHREHDRHEIARLRLREYTQIEIANTLNLSLSTIKRELRSLEREWQAEAMADTMAAKAMELRRLDFITREAWKGWELSLVKQTTETTEEGGRGSRTTTKTASTSGDPRYLNTLMAAMERRCKILGIDASSKIYPASLEAEGVAHGVFVVPAPAASLDEWLEQVNVYQAAKADETTH
ncbi:MULTISPECIES: helix-turn-helix domain-containing protein [unclassified Marinobacter]|jgi:hypothetical protein|uniref:helix-turn-helix domain-containing protein n=1 Tax=unclassified Marinobacter TaxID=83889 RepID=UPI00200E27CA|nr:MULTISPECIES: helix-turn-helix domain-containing protein [unclassified Marinobacter]MCL1483661.1 helix-turn-helix domain-containing protein [Marinobacter sp.]UQG56691.1 helix-turn-helix domain-containing protein [Marinobacter sp. M4C]UQG65495.1 helix-turn-helix domain-containing protein [Marinobacter sp. M2C]UQG69775.1 helix-turn-helix domain-containing protein [Marinobacter sp. M1C]